MRILIGHRDSPLPPYDSDHYDVRVVRYGPDGQRPAESIAEMLAQCPPGWKPDVYFHYAIGHFPLPGDIEEFEGLTVGSLEDWDRTGRGTWSATPFFDLILTDRPGCALLQAGGYANAKFVRFWAAAPQAHRLLPGVERDLDVAFVGMLSSGIWEERNRWLDRLARLSDRYRILIASGHHGDDYIQLLNRAKIVFNRSVRGETNGRAYEAPMCGALCFNEAENTEIREIFTDRVHTVYYSTDDFEALLDYYLTHEEERAQIVENARQVILAEHTFDQRGNALFACIEENLSARGYRPAKNLTKVDRAARKALQIYGGAYLSAAGAAGRQLDIAEAEGAAPGQIATGRAALTAWQAHFLFDADKIAGLTQAIQRARSAVKIAPNSPLAQMTLGFLLLERAEATQGAHPTGRNDIIEAAVALSTAAERCETALISETEDGAPIEVEGLGYPRWNDAFDAHVERAYLLRLADESRWRQRLWAVVAWRCHSMLSDLALANDQREEAYRQAQAAAIPQMSDEAESWLRLARCEAMTGRLEEAIEHYRNGLTIAPFAHGAWTELTTVLAATGRRDEAEAFVQERLRVIRAIPALSGLRAALREALD